MAYSFIIKHIQRQVLTAQHATGKIKRLIFKTNENTEATYQVGSCIIWTPTSLSTYWMTKISFLLKKKEEYLRTEDIVQVFEKISESEWMKGWMSESISELVSEREREQKTQSHINTVNWSPLLMYSVCTVSHRLIFSSLSSRSATVMSWSSLNLVSMISASRESTSRLPSACGGS